MIWVVQGSELKSVTVLTEAPVVVVGVRAKVPTLVTTQSAIVSSLPLGHCSS